MYKEPRIITVRAGSELARLLEEAAEPPLVLEKDGMRYLLDREENDIWSGYVPEAARAGIRATAGSWSDIDAEKLKANLYRAREEGSRPADRP